MQEIQATEQDALAVVAHEMAGPLQVLAMQLAALRGQSSTQETPQLVRMARAVDALRVLARDLLDADRISAGNFELESSDHDLSAVVREVVASFGDAAAKRGIALSSMVPMGLIVRCDALRIAQVLHNLVANALKFSPVEATVDVQAHRVANEVVITVTDAGPGIAPEHRQRMFAPRWLVPGERRRGHGIGLFVARQLVEAHRGRIWVEDAAHRGTMMAFSLPCNVGA